MFYYDCKISEAFNGAEVVDVTRRGKYAIISDVHRGTGDVNDNFAPNQNIFFSALKHYYANGYTYVELGDSDELWENRRIEPIIAEYSHVFWLMNEFAKKDKLILLYGNHDIVKRKLKWRQAHFSTLFNETETGESPMFTNLRVPESLIFQLPGGERFYLTHGHQSELLNSTFWRIARQLVRHVWRPLESLGLKQPAGTAEHRAKKEISERRMIRWCRNTGHSLIAGHTHRPRFPKSDEPQYFNDGSCVHPRCITAIELTADAIALVKWSVETRGDGTLYIKRSILETRKF